MQLRSSKSDYLDYHTLVLLSMSCRWGTALLLADFLPGSVGNDRVLGMDGDDVIIGGGQ